MRDLQAIHADRDQVREAIANAAQGTDVSQWQVEEMRYTDELAEATAYWADQDRVQAQAEKIDTITLAYDYNEILGNPLANETIIENVKQFQLQAYEEHNAEVARINAENKSNLEALYTRHNEVTEQFINDKNDLQRRLDAENEQAKLDAIELGDLTQKVAQLGLEKQEAEQARDNAARLLEEANAEVEKHKQSTLENVDLRQQIEALKQELTAKKALTVSGNEKLAELAAKAKESTAAAAQRGIDRWNQQYGMDIPVLEEQAVKPVNDVVTEQEAPAQEIPFPEAEVQSAESTVVEGSSNSDREVAAEESEVVTRAEFNELKGRVDILFNNQDIGQKEAA